MHDSCRKPTFITDTHHSCFFMSLLSFNLIRSTNHGRKGVHVQHFCPSDFQPHIHKCLRLPAGNWVFQAQRLNSSSWLCWEREYHWFFSSLFLGQGCKNEQNVPMVATVCHSDQSLMKRRGNEAEAESCELLFLQIKVRLLRFTEELWFLLHCLFMLFGGLMDLRISNVTLLCS